MTIGFNVSYGDAINSYFKFLAPIVVSGHFSGWELVDRLCWVLPGS